MEKQTFTKTIEVPTGTLTKGTTFANRYEVLEELGEGGMGQVFKVYDTKINENIALKLLKPEIAADKQVLSRFSNELKFARKITHKNICRMHDINEIDGTTFISMEYVEGEDLKSVIQRKKKLRIGHVISMALQITDALGEAHGLNIVHRDLKPQNIMIDTEGSIRIMDFGIARALDGKSVTNGGMILGSPDYMSPEQVDGKKVDQRSDIYSLGVILYEMATAMVPFKGATPFDTALKHKSEEPNDPRTINTQMPAALAQTILHCMEKDKNKRYQSSKLLLADLLEIQKALPEKDKVATRLMPHIPTLRKERPFLQRLLVPVSAVIAMAVIGLIAWQFLAPAQVAPIEEGRSRIAVLPFQNNTGDPSHDHWRDTLALLLTNDLMQSKYFSVVSEDRVFEVLNDIDFLEGTKLSVDDLERFNEEAVVSHFIQGSLARAGDNYRINVTLYDANSLDAIAAENSDGTSEESLFFMVDELTRKLKPSLNLTEEEIAQDYDVDISAVSSPDPRAIEFYIESRKVRTLRGDVEQEVALLERAVAIDPDFAIAYKLLAEAHRLMGLQSIGNRKENIQKMRAYATEAYEAMQRREVTLRERMLVENIYYHTGSRDPARAISVLEELKAIYPDDFFANSSLVSFYHNQQEDYEKSRDYCEILVNNNTANTWIYLWLGQTYVNRGLYEEGRQVYQRGIEKFPDHWQLYCALAAGYTMEGKFSQALSVCGQGAAADPLHKWRCQQRYDVFYFMEDFQSAEAECQKFLDHDEAETRSVGRDQLIFLYALQGRFEDIFKQIDLARELGEVGEAEHKYRFDLVYCNYVLGDLGEALDLCGKPSSPYVSSVLKVMVLAKVHDYKAAELIVENYIRRVEENRAKGITRWEKNRQREIFFKKGIIELEKGNLVQAIVNFEECKLWNVNIHEELFAFNISPLALAYFKMGDLERAKEEYELILSMTYGRKWWGEIYAKSYYMLGKIFELQGDRKNAIEHYERFLDLWKNADPRLVEVDDARARLASLTD